MQALLTKTEPSGSLQLCPVMGPGAGPATHHAAHHSAHVDRAAAAGAVTVTVLQELGVDVQEHQADVQDPVFKLYRGNKRRRMGVRSHLLQEACLEAQQLWARSTLSHTRGAQAGSAPSL